MGIEKYTNRSSVRDFTSEKLTDNERKLLIEVINNSPTSINNQQFTAILIESQEGKDFIQAQNWGQKFIGQSAGVLLFVADRSRIQYILEKNNLVLSENKKFNELIRSVNDATIAITYAMDALRELGYHGTMLGGQLSNSDKLKDYFNLPDNSVVVLGFAFGKPLSLNEFKPKLNKVYLEKFNQEEDIQRLNEYELTMQEYLSKRGEANPSYFARIAQVVNLPSYDTIFGQASDVLFNYLKNLK